jgi:hypothetical protein
VFQAPILCVGVDKMLPESGSKRSPEAAGLSSPKHPKPRRLGREFGGCVLEEAGGNARRSRRRDGVHEARAEDGFRGKGDFREELIVEKQLMEFFPLAGMGRQICSLGNNKWQSRRGDGDGIRFIHVDGLTGNDLTASEPG